MPMESGFIVMDMLAGGGELGVPIVRDALLLTVPAVAVISTIVSETLAVNVTTT
jgi:hypothetical protein